MIGAVICSQSFGRMPQLVWDVRSMESVLRFAYAAMVTSPGIPLKVCKNWRQGVLLRTDEGAKQLKKVVSSLRAEGVADSDNKCLT